MNLIVSEPRIIESNKGIIKGLENPKLWENLSEKEESFLKKDLGSWTPTETMFFSNGWESLGTLLWSIGLSDKPDIKEWHKPVNPALLFRITGIIPQNLQSINSWLEKERIMRDSKELIKFRHVGEAWHWRIQASYLRKIREDPKEQLAKMPAGVKALSRNIDSAIEQATLRAEADGLIPFLMDDDFPIGNDKSFIDLTDEEVYELSDVTDRRLVTIGWLFFKNDWDLDPKDVQYAEQVPSIWIPEEEKP